MQSINKQQGEEEKQFYKADADLKIVSVALAHFSPKPLKFSALFEVLGSEGAFPKTAHTRSKTLKTTCKRL